MAERGYPVPDAQASEAVAAVVDPDAPEVDFAKLILPINS